MYYLKKIMLRLLYLFGDSVASTSVVCRSLVAFEIVGWFAVVVFLSFFLERAIGTEFIKQK